MHSYSLSLEEYAFALGVMGGAETAAGFLLSTLGPISEQERGIRLTTASHSLLARGLIGFNPTTQHRTILPEFERLLMCVLQSSMTLRVTNTQGDRDEVLTLFVDKQMGVSNQVINAVTVQLEELRSQAHCIEKIGQFVNAMASREVRSIGKVSAKLLDLLKPGAPSSTKEESLQLLAQASVDDDTSRQIVQHAHMATQRGSLFSLQTDNQSSVLAPKVGFLFLANAGSGWLFEIATDELNTVTIYPMTSGVITHVCQAFIPALT